MLIRFDLASVVPGQVEAEPTWRFGVPHDIQLRHFCKADPAYGEDVATGPGIDVREVKAA